eukprot:INCI8303.1.p1 GENE.INCI8303.1~~INCI8303.1.p1  ORF type:complete len:447 (-),score=41.33 INCI8303.1:586-1926(-)
MPTAAVAGSADRSALADSGGSGSTRGLRIGADQDASTSSAPSMSSSLGLASLTPPPSRQRSNSRISPRGHGLRRGPLCEFVGHFNEAIRNVYHPVTNPEGCIVASVSENRPGFRHMVKLFRECAQDFPDKLAGYNDMTGIPMFKKAIATWMQANFGGYDFQPGCVCVGAGCGFILNALASILCDEDQQALLIPTPTYYGFESDMVWTTNTTMELCQTKGPAYRLNIDVVRAAVEQARERGNIVKLIAFTNPVNPTGICLTKAELEGLVEFANEKHVHLLCDEIYAKSVYAEGAKFVSVAQVCHEQNIRLGDFVHIVYGFSKDFCMSGMRVGFVYSENEWLQGAIKYPTYLGSTSTQTQFTLARMLNEADRLGACFEAITSELRRRYMKVVARLRRAGLNFIPSQAGMFTLIDLRHMLSQRTWDAEQQLYDSIYRECRTLLTPGQKW